MKITASLLDLITAAIQSAERSGMDRDAALKCAAAAVMRVDPVLSFRAAQRVVTTILSDPPPGTAAAE